MNYIEKMSQKQDSLNEHTVKGWLSVGNPFRRALWLEAAEAMESTPWKWWKDGKLDIGNLKVESIDMMHFALSVVLQSGYSGWQWLDNEVTAAFDRDLKIPDDRIPENIMNLIETIVMQTFADSMASHGPHEIIITLAELMNMIGMDRDEMYKLYMGKNILNEFRQNHGYKEGTYDKEWFGEEDNVFMTNALSEIGISDHFEDDLYKALEGGYKEVQDAKESKH